MAVFGHDSVARSSIAARVSVEGMADTTGVAGAESSGDITVGGDGACGDLADEGIDLGEEVHKLNEKLCLPFLLKTAFYLASSHVAAWTST